MNILGLYGAVDWDPMQVQEEIKGPWIHDSGATLFTNGQHICSIQEERLSREKADGKFPYHSIQYCLDEGNIKEEDIDLVCYAHGSALWFSIRMRNGSLHEKIKSIFPNAEIKIYSHHMCHSAASIFSCDENSGTFISIDGSGSPIFTHFDDDPPPESIDFRDYERATYGYFNKSKKIFRMHNFHSGTNEFGGFYHMNSIGLYMQKMQIDYLDRKQKDSVPGKIMGLSAYGSELDWSDDYLLYRKGSEYEYKIPYVCFNTNKNLHSMELTIEEKCYVLQKNFELAMVDLVEGLYEEKYLDDVLCLSGGSFLNVLGNNLIRKTGRFKTVHVPPYPNDTGLHFGAAAYGAWMNDYKIQMPKNISLLGKKYLNCKEVVQEANLDKEKFDIHEFENFKELCRFVAANIKHGIITAWYQGRSEYGPRALGSRSILMHPGPEQNKDILNERVKHREYWRPFAGAILEEYVNEYFEEDYSSPYMLFSYTTRKEKVHEIQAITHLDRTCRVQTVTNETNSKLYELLKEFYRESGTPILLNTSFNDNGEPIVETPQDAIASFLTMDIDMLVIDNQVICKK